MENEAQVNRGIGLASKAGLCDGGNQSSDWAGDWILVPWFAISCAAATTGGLHFPANFFPVSSAPGAMGGQVPSLEQMKQMADTKAAPLLEKLKGNPNNTDLLGKVGDLYQGTHQFKAAAGYYDKALQIDPKNVPLHTQLASCLYYQGDIDGAISQLQQGLHYDPKDANSLFNLGIMKLQGKKDIKGALAAWHLLLSSNPQLSADRKARVQKLIADIRMQSKSQRLTP